MVCLNLENLPDLITIEEVADYIRVSKPAAKRILESYKVPYIQFDEKNIRIKKDAFKTFINNLGESNS